MGKTFKDKKVHQGQIQKQINAEERERKRLLEEEAREAAKWVDYKKPTKIELKKIKDEEKRKHKLKLQEIYEQEMRELQ